MAHYMRQAICTKYHGPTNYRGSRVTASAQAGRLTISWDDALDVDANHAKAAEAFRAKLGWSGTLRGGALPKGDGYCFVLCDD